jgi:ATP-dependent exoDNAse (exonuclease V) beta subunit
MKRNNYQAYVSERLRLFYVAMTRAKEKMIFIINQDKWKNQSLIYNHDGNVNLSIRRGYRRFLDLFESVPSTIKWGKEVKITLPKIRKMETTTPQNPKSYFHYDFMPRVLTPSQYSKHSLEVIDSDTKAKMAFGETIHRAFELFDFHHIEHSLLSTSSVALPYIVRFFEHFPRDEWDQAEVFQEYEFVYENENEVNNGIIDIFYLKDNQVTIIDYKLKNLSDPSYQKQVEGYMQYLFHMTGIIPKAYLYSLITGEKKEVLFHATHSHSETN